MSTKPNVIFIHNDHQSYYQYLDSPVKPKRENFDKLASEGANFTNAYCASPLCGPTRRTLLHGLYQHTHKQFNNYSDSPYKHEVYLDTFADAGYDNFYYGKYHGGPGNALQFKNVSGLSHDDYGNPYIREDYQNYIKERNLPCFEASITRNFDIPTNDTENGRRYYSKLKTGEQNYTSIDPNYCGEHCYGITTTPKETTESFFLASLACDKLEEIAKSGEDTPFTLRVDFWGPHQPYFPTQEYLDMYKDKKFPKYPSYDSGLIGKPDMYHVDRNFPISTNQRINIPNSLPWEVYNEMMQYACAQITMVDDAAGLILDKVKELGFDENTVIIMTTDHGDGLACHGGHFDKECFMAQEVLRVPMAIKFPGKIKPGTVVDRLVNTIDMPITMLDAAGLKITKNEVHGKSLLPLASGELDPADYENVTFCETNGHTYVVRSRVIVMDDMKYVATLDEMDELYNLKEDKYELRNLIDDERYAQSLKALRARLLKWQQDTGDDLLFDWHTA